MPRFLAATTWSWVIVVLGLGYPCSTTEAYAFGSYPVLMLQPHTLDLGTVNEGGKVEGELVLRNTGNVPLSITRIQTSCGCTTGMVDERLLPPGGFTILHVKVDTFAKRGKVRKEIWVNDGSGHTATAYLKLAVRSNPHMNIQGRSIFDGKCAACHAAPAKGKSTGPAIYAAVCAMCHGPGARGGYAPELPGQHDARHLESLISNGTGNHYMPGFASSRGGPLAPAQVHTLSLWLASLR